MSTNSVSRFVAPQIVMLASESGGDTCALAQAAGMASVVHVFSEHFSTVRRQLLSALVV